MVNDFQATASNYPLAKKFNLALKRACDISLSMLLLVMLSCPMLVIAAIIWLEDNGPILFTQERVGLHKQPFKLLKFRSMVSNIQWGEGIGQVRLNHPGITSTGRIIRRLKIDELPQLINVVKGDMSLLGPRPTILSQVDQYTDVQLRRLSMRPGISGWAQVNGNTELDWASRIALDLWYIDHWSLMMDLKILLKTMAVVIGGEKADPTAVQEAIIYANSADRCGPGNSRRP